VNVKNARELGAFMHAQDTSKLLDLLKKYFGFSSFRPLQEDIIRDVLAGRDVLALLPTGGGKSLCFQLPAAAESGLTVVVSPLIALMKDQVDALRASGIAATFLNSTLDKDEAKARLGDLEAGKYQLLYVAPERLMLRSTLDLLQKWKVNRIAIDEAHCISEWGHDFRPEYRQLSSLREKFRDVPLMALTATATERVRQDIVEQLHLREPGIYVASFNRPNLIYRVTPKQGAYNQLVEFIRKRPNESGIVYCQARKTADSVAERLNADGITARAYHAGMENADRARNQELFICDEVRVICATIAFGMGINKLNVRYIVHYDLPKNIEGYYQETGRAGRDGLPSECLLLFSRGDAMKQERFINEKPDPKEQEIARQQLQQMIYYAECRECRRISLLRYFGEEFNETNCKACDNCAAPRDVYDGTVAAQKFLSCIYRVHQMSKFSVDINHIVEVLTGGDTEGIRKWNHQQLSTYGIGREHGRPEWMAIGRELIRLGYIRQLAEKFNVLELTDSGRELLRTRKAVLSTSPPQAPELPKSQVGQISCDDALFERLRRLRKRLADERAVPPYVVFSDVALRQMARSYPANEQEFSRISGVGQRKLQEFGVIFLKEIADYLRISARQIFAEEIKTSAVPRRSERRKGLNDSARETLLQFREGASVEKIALKRGLVTSTIYGHLATGLEMGEAVDLRRFVSAADESRIAAAFAKCGLKDLARVREMLGEKYDFPILQVCRAARLRTIDRR
jgi:ATP-dependent DNA helicase RecQ